MCNSAGCSKSDSIIFATLSSCNVCVYGVCDEKMATCICKTGFQGANCQSVKGETMDFVFAGSITAFNEDLFLFDLSGAMGISINR